MSVFVFVFVFCSTIPLPAAQASGVLEVSAAATELPAAQASGVVEASAATTDLTAAEASGDVEASADGESWTALGAGQALLAGTRVRTGADGQAELTSRDRRLRLRPAGRLRVENDRVRLEGGRLELVTAAHVEVAAPGSVLAGSGTAVVRVGTDAVFVSVVEGRFTLEPGAITLGEREGAIVREGRPAEGPLALLAGPTAVQPGEDPLYVRLGSPAKLDWSGASGTQRVVVSRLASGETVRDETAAVPPVVVDLREPGQYKWRTIPVDPRGLETLPSPDGQFCVVER